MPSPTYGEEAFMLLTAAGPTIAAAAKEIRQILDGGI